MRVAFVSNEEIWPATNGGRARMAGLVEAMLLEASVATIEPTSDCALHGTDLNVERRAVRRPGRARWRDAVSLHPRLGRYALPDAVVADVGAAIADIDPHVVVVSHSYLAPRLAASGRPTIVDFQNVEVRRQGSFARTKRGLGQAAALVETAKARRWEPRVARDASGSVAVTEGDARWLRSHGAPRVVVVPNTAEPEPYDPSPVDGPVLLFGSADYPPNAQSGRWFVDEVWPTVVQHRPRSRLVIAGRRTDAVFGGSASTSICVAGEVVDLASVFADAAVVVAPAVAGAGTQLKVMEAVARHRAVVATPFSAQSVPEPVRGRCRVAATPARFAAEVVDLLEDVSARRSAERELGAAVVGWREAAAPLVSLVHEVAGRG